MTVIAAAALCGLVIGCYLNTLAYRLTTDAHALITEDCFCPDCGHRLSLWEQIPVLGYLLLGGRCRFCKARIDVHYPLVEAGCAALYGVLAACCLWETAQLSAFAWFLLLCMLSCTAVTAVLVRREFRLRAGAKASGMRTYLRAAAILVGYHVLSGLAVGIVWIANI